MSVATEKADVGIASNRSSLGQAPELLHSRPRFARENTDADLEKASQGGPALQGDGSDGEREGQQGSTGGQQLKTVGLVEDSPEGAVKRKLKQRHMSMIALGGTIGTGLFVSLGSALAEAGPVNLLIGYTIMGVIVWSMMIALGEMATLFPLSGGFIHFAGRWVDPACGFATGWNYWYSYAITLPTEISAASIIISYWDPSQTINPAVWISIMLVMVWFVNFCGVRWYGEAEFFLSAVKIVTIIGLIILMLCIDLGAGPRSDRIGFRYWKDPGCMAQLFWTADPETGKPTGGISGAKGRFLSFWTVFVNAAYSFSGTEIIGMTVGEAENPRKTVPKAIKRVFWRILLFYVCAIAMIGLVVPYNDSRLLSGASDASASPFVIAIEDAGIKVLPSIINAVLLLTAWSAGNSDLYAASRTVYALALEGQAPRPLRYCTKAGLPAWSLVLTGSIGLLAYMAVGSGGAVTAFTYLYDISAVSAIIAWIVILGTYLRFYQGLKERGISRDTLPYRAPLQPYASWFGFTFLLIVLLFAGYTVFLDGQWDTSTFVTTYITIPLFIVLWLGWKLWYGTSFVKLEEMDFETGRRNLDEMDAAEQESHPPPTTPWGKFFDWLL